MKGVNLLLPVVSKVDSIAKTGVAPVGCEIVKQNGRHFVHALKDMNLEIQPGDRIGLIGHNGAGKTTLMRMMCGIFQPTKGHCKISGRVSTLFSSTIGMDSSATGLENIRFALMLYGVPRQVHDCHIKDIAEFSELGDYLNFPVRTYSAGMKTRLGFAIVTSIDPDILIIDEVLTTGDKAFAEKAKQRIIGFAERASILIVASHSPALLSLFCTRGIWMHRGGIRSDGDFHKVIEEYVAGRHSDQVGKNMSVVEDASANVANLVPKREVPSVVSFERNGKTIELQSAGQRHYADHAALQTFYEQDFLEYTRALDLRGTYLDVGANIASRIIFWGLFSNAEAIVGFEPQSFCRNIAIQNIESNKLPITTDILPYAAGSKNCELEISFDGGPERVEVKRIDDLNFLKNVSLVKIDIEEMEPEALLGMKALLERDCPIVFCEIRQEENEIKFNADSLISLMETLDYEWTGRVFNYTPTLEFWPRRKLKMEQLDKNLIEWKINPSSFIPSNFTGFVQPEAENSAVFHLDASPKIFFAQSLEDFSKPSYEIESPLNKIHKQGECFLEIDATPVGNVEFSVIVNQYDDSKMVRQDRYLCNRRKVQQLNLSDDVGQMRIILEAKGSGYIDIRRLIITQMLGRDSAKPAKK